MRCAQRGVTRSVLALITSVLALTTHHNVVVNLCLIARSLRVTLLKDYQVFFVESVCENLQQIENNILSVKVKLPDYKEVELTDAVADFKVGFVVGGSGVMCRWHF